jgi:hypothetical protein
MVHVTNLTPPGSDNAIRAYGQHGSIDDSQYGPCDSRFGPCTVTKSSDTRECVRPCGLQEEGLMDEALLEEYLTFCHDIPLHQHIGGGCTT